MKHRWSDVFTDRFIEHLQFFSLCFNDFNKNNGIGIRGYIITLSSPKIEIDNIVSCFEKCILENLGKLSC